MNSGSDFFNSFISKSESERKQAAADILNGMDSKQAAQIKNILADEGKIKEILSSPQAQQLMKKLKGSGNGQHK